MNFHFLEGSDWVNEKLVAAKLIGQHTFFFRYLIPYMIIVEIRKYIIILVRKIMIKWSDFTHMQDFCSGLSLLTTHILLSFRVSKYFINKINLIYVFSQI